MRISLNLATRPFADLGPANKRLRIGMGVLAILALFLGLGLHLLHSKAEAARARDHSLDGQIARITQERQGYQNLMKLPANHQVLLQAQVLNKLFDEKTFSWTLAMEDLETVLPGGVMVSTLEPRRDEKTKKFTVNLHVIGPRDRAVELVSNLEHSKRFLFPRIIGENSDAAGGAAEKLQPVSASNRVNFELLAEYKPASPEERKAAAKKSHAAELAAPSQPAPIAAQPRAANPGGRPPYNGSPQPPHPQVVNSPPPPPNLNSPEDNSLAARRMRALSRRGRNQNNPNAPPGGPQ
jgi:type IV pilus assembly protein PilN